MTKQGPQVSLVDARVSDINRTWLMNVYPFYLHDLSEFDEGYYHLDEDGLWKPDHLPSWLDEKKDWPLLIITEDQRVGFALVNQAPSPHLTPGMDYRMSEFFVLRGHRRNRLGEQAVFKMFDRFRGRWELGVLRRNLGALSFWRRILAEYTRGSYSQEITPDVVRHYFQT